LHETGDPALDSLTIEYNGVLAIPPFREEATQRAAEWLLDSAHGDEVSLPGVSAATLRTFDRHRMAIRLRDAKPVYTVDLDSIAAAHGNFMATLSANTRAQLRRAMRRYESLGALRLVEAATADEALRMLTDMIPLHQAYWRQRGRDGAFANPAILSFHRRLIGDSFGNGSIQFLRCDAGDSVLGYLYNFGKDKHVYSYQSGFDYDLVPRSKPGWVCHYLAIEENLRRGMAVYDLLAGHSQFKSSFGKAGTELVWVLVERQGWLPALDRSLRALKRMIVGNRQQNQTSSVSVLHRTD
jgi:CelD/BcsL family acetyltransferase involved in cellulose biosynthesis